MALNLTGIYDLIMTHLGSFGNNISRQSFIIICFSFTKFSLLFFVIFSSIFYIFHKMNLFVRAQPVTEFPNTCEFSLPNDFDNSVEIRYNVFKLIEK